MSRSAEPEAMDFIAAFNDPQAAAQYAEGPRRFVPGYEALHRMTAILLAEGSPANARVLVLGAGGGLELRALAEAHPT
jgi:tRNA (cmo5U34)-methyltransferase